MLGCVEFCVPGRNLEEKLKVLEKHKMWLELVNEKKRKLEVLNSFSVEVKTVQAYRLHDLHLLSRNAAVRKAALQHVKDTIEIAREIGAANVLTAAYGFNSISFKKAVEIFRVLSECNIKILIEALDLKRTSFLPSVKEILHFIKKVDRENIALAADTFHAHETGENVADIDEIIELHLRDTDSKAPGKGSLNFDKILKMCREKLLCLEYKTKNPKRDLESAVKLISSFF